MSRKYKCIKPFLVIASVSLWTNTIITGSFTVQFSRTTGTLFLPCLRISTWKLMNRLFPFLTYVCSIRSFNYLIYEGTYVRRSDNFFMTICTVPVLFNLGTYLNSYYEDFLNFMYGILRTIK